MRRLSPPIFALTLAILTSACVQTPTSFHPLTQSSRDGYTVTQVEGNRFRISFTGNDATSHQSVDDNLLFLAAEVTLRHGADWFLINRASSDKDTSYPTLIDPSGPYGGWGYGGWGAPPGAFGTYAVDFGNPQNRWSELATILLHQGTKPAGDPSAYDARDVAVHLAPLITRAAQPGPYGS